MVTGGPGSDLFGASRGRGGPLEDADPWQAHFAPSCVLTWREPGSHGLRRRGNACAGWTDVSEDRQPGAPTGRSLAVRRPRTRNVYPGALPIRRRRNHRSRRRNAHRSAGIVGRARGPGARGSGVSSSVTLTGSLALLPVLASRSAPWSAQTERARWAAACRAGPRADFCGTPSERARTAAHHQHASWSSGAVRAPGDGGIPARGSASVRVDPREAASQRVGADRP